jgi:hypothetical protein
MSRWLLLLLAGSALAQEPPAPVPPAPAEPAPAEPAPAEPAPAEPRGPAPLELRVFMGPSKPGGGTLIVQAEYAAEGQVRLPDPEVDKLQFEPDGEALAEQVGDRNVLTQRYVFRGPAGSYEIPPLVATWTREGESFEASSRSVFVDLDTKPPREGELADIVEPPALWRLPWAPILLVGALFAGGLLIAFRPRRVRELPPVLPDPPDVLALAAWDEVRLDPSLTIDDKAREVARIFREYVEAVLGFEASSRTTSELLAHLQSLQHLPEGNVPRARRVLRAADRVKYAEDRPREDIAGWLAELDADLRAFVESTRPSSWRRDPAAPGTAKSQERSP